MHEISQYKKELRIFFLPFNVLTEKVTIISKGNLRKACLVILFSSDSNLHIQFALIPSHESLTSFYHHGISENC